MKLRVAVSDVSRSSSGEIVGVRVACHPYWVMYVKDLGRKLRWIDKGPKYRGAWPEIPPEVFTAMRCRAYAEVFRKISAKPGISKNPAVPKRPESVRPAQAEIPFK